MPIGTETAPTETPVVMIVDDDANVRGSMDSLFRSVGLRTELYGSAQELLDAERPTAACCMVVDVRLPQISGLEFHARLVERGDTVPIIFVTGHGDIPMSVKAMKAGAVDFLAKPFRDQDMLDAVATALQRDRDRRDSAQDTADSRQRYATLTPRERQVMKLVCSGLMNKQTAGELGLSEITIKLHRASAMRKMGVRTLPDLVRLSESLTRDGIITE